MSIGKVVEGTIRGIVGVVAFCVGLVAPGFIAFVPLRVVGASAGEFVCVILGAIAFVGTLLGFFTFLPVVMLCDNGMVNLIRGVRGLFGKEGPRCTIGDLTRTKKFALTVLVRYRFETKSFGWLWTRLMGTRRHSSSPSSVEV